MTKMALLSDNFLKVIGKVTFNFSGLEAILHEFLRRAIGNPDPRIADCIGAQLSFRNLVNLDRSLFKLIPSEKEALEELEALVLRAFSAEQRRNTITHSKWGPSSDGSKIVRMKSTARESLKHQKEELTVVDIDDIAQEIGQVSSDIQSFVEKHLK